MISEHNRRTFLVVVVDTAIADVENNPVDLDTDLVEVQIAITIVGISYYHF